MITVVELFCPIEEKSNIVGLVTHTTPNTHTARMLTCFCSYNASLGSVIREPRPVCASSGVEKRG